jgi:glycosyltransferase involved in cell wall biosynthesis
LAALNAWQIGHLFNKLLFALMALVGLYWRHRRVRYDVVHIEEPLAAFLALLLPRHAMPPIVFSTMGPMPTASQLSDLPPKSRERLLSTTLALPAYIHVPAKALLSFNLRHAARVVVNSDALRSALATFFQLEPGAIDVVHAGADTDFFHPGVDGSRVRQAYRIEATDPLILSMGPVQPRKGQMKLLKALPYILRRHPTARVMVVGFVLSPSYERALRELVASQGVERHVIFTGPVPRHRLPEYYGAADLFVMLSTAEGGVAEALLEAMSCGRACLASDIPNNRVAAPDGNAVLFVDPDDPQAVAEAINGLLDDPSRCADLGRKARRTVMRHFHWDALAQQMVRVYEKVLAGDKG